MADAGSNKQINRQAVFTAVFLCPQVRLHLAVPGVLPAVFDGLAKLQGNSRLTLKLLHCLARLALCPGTLENLEAAGAIEHLVRPTDPTLPKSLGYSKPDGQSMQVKELPSACCSNQHADAFASTVVPFISPSDLAVVAGGASCAVLPVRWEGHAGRTVQGAAGACGSGRAGAAPAAFHPRQALRAGATW